MNARKSAGAAGEAVKDEVSAFLEDVVNLARSITHIDSERLEELKEGFRERLGRAEAAARETARNLADEADDALDRADSYAHENPGHLVLAAGLAGLEMGVLVARR